MATANFQLTGNEDSLLRIAFPVGHDITENHVLHESKAGRSVLSSFFQFDMPISKLFRLALYHSDNQVIPVIGFKRVLTRGPQTDTDLGGNWLDPMCRYCVRLSEEQRAQLDKLALTFHGNRTYAIVWMLRNFSAMLAEDHTLISAPRRPSRLTDANSGKVNVRLPNHVLQYYDHHRQSESLGKMIREAVMRDYARLMADNQTPMTSHPVCSEETQTTEDDDFFDEFEDIDG